MNEAEKKHEVIEDAKLSNGALVEAEARKYTLRTARQAIQRKETAIQKRQERITALQLENQGERAAIRDLETICIYLQSQEVMKKLDELRTAGSTIETEQINKALEFLTLVGDAFSLLSVQQLAEAVNGAAEQTGALAALAQAQFDEATAPVKSGESET